MNKTESDVILKLSNIADQLLSGKRKIKIELEGIEGIEDEGIKSLAEKIKTTAEQYMDCYGFIIDLSYGKLYTESPRANAFANPFKQLHSALRHLTWQIQQIADGDYDQRVTFSGDFSESINKMILALRERQVLTERILEDENLFRSIFSTSPDGIILCDLSLCILNASNTAYRMCHAAEEIKGKLQYLDFIHPEDISVFKWLISTLLAESNDTASGEIRVVKLNGDIFWSEQNISMLLDSNSDPKGYIIVIRDISERKAAEAQLLQYTDDLNESNRTKDKMFSIISHDLKSPFSALLGTSEMLVRESAKENLNIEKIGKLSRIINDSANRTFGLLNNLLEWARLQSDKIVINPEKINLDDIVVENVNISITAAMSKNINLQYTTPGFYPIVSDKAVINTILRNLISNAIKYTPQNGEITVSLIQIEDIYMIAVRDSGIGIPEDKVNMMFQSDTIQSTPGTANEKGTGLGLGLCKDFVTKLGGDIWVESVYGQGATFSFTLKNIQ